ncbi:MAG TPA: site-2 protease family protein [Thermoanaerobaculia bacterium]|nr:site-2 protease family protein [Thermoanaerobaculia bacterium]
MTSATRIATVAGIEIKIHVTFGIILVIGAVQWGIPHGAAGAAFGAALMAALFFCVVLHELGHSLVARGFGLPVKEIVLLPIGGVARMEKNPEKPVHELLISVAGPLVNVAIAGVLLAAVGARFGPLDAAGLAARLKGAPSVETALLWLLSVNVMLFVFNMIPAFPMDGGRVLRALLWMVMGFGPATRIATLVGQVAAVGLGLWGLLSGNLFLALIAVFVFLGAGQERADEQARVVLGTLRVGDAYNKHAIALAPGDTVGSVADYILTSYQPDFAVLQGGALLGVVTRADVLQSLATETHDSYVTGVMKRDVLRVEADAPLDSVRRLLVEKGERVAAVTRGGTYLGLVSLEDIAEALLVVAFRAAQDTRRKAVETA